MEEQQPPVRVIRSARRHKTVNARMRNGVLEVRIPAAMSAQQEHEVVADMQRRWQQRRSSTHISDEQLAQRAHDLNHQYLEGRAQFSSIRWVANQHSRWGSCTPATGSIRISHRLREVPSYVLDSVIIHELVHTFIPGHGPEFWRWAQQAPQAERAAGYLEAYGHFLNQQQD